MRKSTRNYLVALIMFLLALFQAVSGFVLWLVLPRGGGYRGGIVQELNTFLDKLPSVAGSELAKAAQVRALAILSKLKKQNNSGTPAVHP